MLRTVLSRTVLGIVCLACLASLTACGLKGPLYLPERTESQPLPQSTPLATPAPAPQATSPFGDDPADPGNAASPAENKPQLESSTRLTQ